MYLPEMATRLDTQMSSARNVETLNEVAEFHLRRMDSKTGKIKVSDLLAVQITRLGVPVLDHQVELITRMEVTVLDHQVELTTSLGVDLQGVLVIDHREVRTTELVLIVLIDHQVETRTEILQEVHTNRRVETHTDLVLAVLSDHRVVLHIDLQTKTTSVHLQHKDFRVLEVGDISNLLEVRCGGNHLDRVTEALHSNNIPSLA